MLKGYGKYGAVASSNTPVYRGGGDKRTGVIASASKERYKETAYNNTSGSSLANMNVRALGMNFELGAMEGMLPESRQSIVRLCRDIYKYDTVSGAAVDLMSNLPFSDFNLTGINDRKILATYVKSIENLKMTTLFPYLGRDFLTDGAFTATLEFDSSRGIFNNITTHDNMYIEAQDVPIFGYDPILTLKLPRAIMELKTGKSKDDPRVKKILGRMPKFIQDASTKGNVLLDPINTLYIARKSFSFDSIGMSYLHRIIPLWLIEKSMLRGSIEQSYQRQRAITHITAGTDEWEPTDDELRQMVSLVVNANMDPTGAVIATRPDINFQEIIRGDDFYKHCMAGDSLIATEDGLMRIDEMASAKNKATLILGGEGAALTSKWHETGVKAVYSYKLENGYEVRATKDHRFMVFKDDYSREWKTGEELEKGDLLCIQTKTNLRVRPLALPTVEDRGSLKFPSVMTPKLAYAIGLLNSKGWANSIMINFGHNNQTLRKVFTENMSEIFSIQPIKTVFDPSTVRLMVANPSVKFTNRKVADFLAELGIERKPKKQELHDYKCVPKSIRLSPEEPQLAYVAACVEAIGWTTKSSIEFLSSQKDHLKQLQILLAAHGHIGILEEDLLIYKGLDASELYSKISPFFRLVHEPVVSQEDCSGCGIDANRIYEFVDSLVQGEREEGQKLKLLAENGEIIETDAFDERPEFWSLIDFQEARYASQMYVIKKLSSDLYSAISGVFYREFCFAEFVSKEEDGNEPTYDLTMDSEYENSFVANGVVVHNSDVYDYLAQAKLRALNISDSFLSGESTITTMEVALSVFMEQIKQFRATVTRETFYDKIFPSIAYANKFKKTRRDMMATSGEDGVDEYDMNGSIRMVNGKLIAVCDSSGLHDVKNIEDITEYYIPKVEWHKQLAPQADREYLDLLASMREQGIPVPIRMTAAAAGLNIDNIMAVLEEDLQTRETLGEHLKAISKLSGEEDTGSFASFMNEFEGIKKPKGRVQELAETQGYEVNERLKSGRRRPSTAKHRRALEEEQDKKIARALGRISRGEVSSSKLARTIGRRLLTSSAYGKLY